VRLIGAAGRWWKGSWADARAQVPAAFRRIGVFLLLDVLAAGVAYAWLATRFFPAPLQDPQHRVIPGYMQGVPGDFGGTAWFYGWYAQARARGVPVDFSDVVCAPTGQALGSNFPQHLDAWLAQPFVAGLGFPAGYNLFMVAVLAASALAGHWGLRALTRDRLVAFVGGAFFGFSVYGSSELLGGRPTVALVAFVPLFIGCWHRLLGARGAGRWGWGLAAGVIASLAVQHYVVYAGLLGLYALLAALVRAIAPAPGVSRWRPVTAILAVGIVALGCSAPYLHYLLVHRPVPGVSAASLGQGHPLDPTVWFQVARELLGPLLSSSAQPSGAPTQDSLRAALRALQEQSLPVAYLWGRAETPVIPRVFVPPVLPLVALGCLPFGRLRGLAWAGATAVFYSLTLGPAACVAIRPAVQHLVLAGHAWLMPSHLLLHLFPWIAQAWHPVRGFPLVLFCLLACLAVGLDGLGRSLARLVPNRRVGSTVALLVPAALICLVAWQGLRQMDGVQALRWPMKAFAPDPFLSEIAAEEGEFSVIDLPLGLGHGLGVEQLVHQRPRANGHHDDVANLLAGRPPPEDCYRLQLLRGLWDLQIMARGMTPPPAAEGDDIQPATDAAAIQQAVDAGFRYAVLFLDGYQPLERPGPNLVERQNLQDLLRVFGPPTYRASRLVVWRLGEGPTDAAR